VDALDFIELTGETLFKIFMAMFLFVNYAPSVRHKAVVKIYYIYAASARKNIQIIAWGYLSS